MCSVLPWNTPSSAIWFYTHTPLTEFNQGIIIEHRHKSTCIMQRNLPATFDLVELHKVQIIQSFSPTERVPDCSEGCPLLLSENLPSAVSRSELCSPGTSCRMVICFSFDQAQSLKQPTSQCPFPGIYSAFFYYFPVSYRVAVLTFCPRLPSSDNVHPGALLPTWALLARTWGPAQLTRLQSLSYKRCTDQYS